MLRILWIGLPILLAASAPNMADAQVAANLWGRIIGALELGILYTSKNMQDLREKECATNVPSPEQFGKLSELLAKQGAISPAVQQRWISQFRCTSVVATRMPARLEVNTDRVGEAVYLNNVQVGITPMAFDVDSGGTFAVRIGENLYRIDTTLVVPPASTVIMQVVTTQRNAGEPPQRDAVERELALFFQAIPDLPSPPLSPKRPGGGSSFGLGLLFAGAATAGALAPCATMATAPSPYGGFLGSTYYPAGKVVPVVRYGCAGLIGGGTLLIGSRIIHAFRKAAFSGQEQRHRRQLAAYRELETNRERRIRSNQRLVDSTIATRRALAAQIIVTRSINIQITGGR